MGSDIWGYLDIWGRGKIYKWPPAHSELGWGSAVEFVYLFVFGTRKRVQAEPVLKGFLYLIAT